MEVGDNTLYAIESDLIFTRFNAWIKETVGEDNGLFLRANNLERQKYILEMFFRFLSSVLVAADLSGQTLERVDTLQGYITRCSFLADTVTNNCLVVGTQASSTDNGTQKYITAFRTRLRSLLRLFQLVSSIDYVGKLVNDYKVLKLGALTLHVWGEALLSYAETSLRYWKPQRLCCLQLAEDRLLKCMAISTNRHQSAYLLGNVFLLQARAYVGSNVYKNLLDKAHKSYSFSAQLLDSFPDYVCGLARVCALLNKEGECQHWLKLWVSARPINPLTVLDDADFDKYRASKWFETIVDSVVPKMSTPLSSTTSFDERQYSILQNSLLESGFSMKKIMELLSWSPISTGQSQIRADEGEEYTRKQKERLQQRLELYQLRPKRDIPGDGNCQMHAISDQLYDTISKSADIRKMVVDWLQKNRDSQLPNGAILHQFMHDRKWEDYCTAMAKDGCWGDHLTLLAISEMFGVQISIFSSVEGDNFITEIHPTIKKLKKVLLLSHYAEFHYGSLEHIIQTPLLDMA